MNIIKLTEDCIFDVMENLVGCTQRAIKQGGGFGWVNVPTVEALTVYWYDTCRDPKIVAFVARTQRFIAGSIQLVLPGPSNEASSFAGSLSKLFVDPLHRGRGLGALLLDTAELEARACRLRQVNLDVRITQEAAMRLYERRGYRVWGENPRYARINGEYVAGRYLSKYLDD